MAFLPKLGVAAANPKRTFLHNNCLWSLWTTLQKSTRIDQIDSFTSELVEKKSLKWGMEREEALQSSSILKHAVYKGISTAAKSLSHDLESIRKPELCVDIRTLTQCQLDNIFSGILDGESERDFLSIVKQCVLYRILPSAELLVRSLEFLANNRRTDLIDAVAEICKELNEPFYRNNAQLLPYKSVSLWRSGNVEMALKTIVTGYQVTYRSKSRKSLRESFRLIANETIGAKSEAVLVTLLKVAESINRDFHEIFVIACIWRNTFSSQWFSDQQLSIELFDKYEMLRAMINKRSTSLCYALLSQHDVDAVHRLIELFLRYESKEACSNCLQMLFNYQHWRKDLRACSEIMQYCLDVNIPLPEIETQKLLDLLLNRPKELYTSIIKTPCNKFQYKF